MSSEVRATLPNPPLGVSLWLLIGLLLMTDIFDLGSLTFLWMAERKIPLDLQDVYSALARAIAHDACSLLAVLMLGLWRRRAALVIATALIWAGPILLIGYGLADNGFTGDIYANLWHGLHLASSAGLLAASGCTAFLLTTPRLQLVYPRTGSQKISARSLRAGRAALGQLPWRLVLVFFMVLPTVTLLLSVAGIIQLQIGNADSSWVTRVLQQNRIQFGFVLMMLGAAAWFWFRRRWSGVTALIALLWLLPIGSRLVAISALRGWESNQLQLIASQPSGAGFSFLAALAWTAYLLESPAIHRRYPGQRRRNDLVTDVDVF